MDITIRFVTQDDIVSDLIRLQGGIAMPFTPSHVEALSRDGQHWIGAHYEGGIAARAIGYDSGGKNRKEKLVVLHVEPAQFEKFHSFLDDHIGEPYDWKSILSFVAPDFNMHIAMHAICSAFIELSLRAIEFFPWRLTVPAHHITPRDLMLILSTHVEISHEIAPPLEGAKA